MNLLLYYKKELENELNIKLKIISEQQEKVDYIKTVLEELEEKFYELNSGDIEFDDFFNYINSIDNKYIYENILSNIKKHINSYDYFYDDLYDLSNTLKKIINQKNTDIILKQNKIEEIKSILENITDEGELINPLSSKKIRTFIDEVKCSNELEFLHEIYLKNSLAHKRKISRGNADKIRKLKEENLVTENNRVKEILGNNDLVTITEEESIFLDDLYNAKNKQEIIEILELMNSDSSSLRLIVFGLNNSINNNKQLIEVYMGLYDEYSKRVNELNEINKKYEDELNILLEQFNEIKLDIYDKHESIIERLTDKQKNQLDSFSDIDMESIDMINKTLNLVGLNVEFLLFYNEHVNLRKKIDNFDNNLNNKEKIKNIKDIISLYENYNQARHNYIDSIDIDIEYDKKDENVVLYLTDENDVTYIERQMEDDDPLNIGERGALIKLINKLKICSSTYIHSSARKVLPYEDDYRKKRLSDRNIRLVFLQISNKYINTDKPVYLVVTAGRKTESKNAEVYYQANHLKGNVLEFIDKLKKLDKEKLDIFLEKQKKIEENLLESISTKQVSIKR